jgi:hypothetical protein
MPRKITPHKSGRTERIDIRVTPQVKKAAFRIAKSQNKSIADLFTDYILSLIPVYKNSDPNTPPQEFG